MTFQRIDPKDLNGRQKEVYNFQKSAALLADYGFNCIKLTDDWLGADFLAYRFDGKTTLRVQLKSRLTIDRKYMGQDLWMNFQCRGTWYLVPHDTLVDLVGEATNWLNTSSWVEHHAYSSRSPSLALLEKLSSFALGLDFNRAERQLSDPRDSMESSEDEADTNDGLTGGPRVVAKLWRHPNVERAADVLTRHGYACSIPPSASQSADISAQRPNVVGALLVRAPGRVGIYKKLIGMDLHVVFPDQRGTWYLVPHDKLVDLVGDSTPWLESMSWRERGGYSAKYPSGRLQTLLRRFEMISSRC